MSSCWRRLSTSGDRTTQACIVNLLLVSGTISAILYFWGANNLFTHFSCIFLFWKISSPWSLKEVQKHDVATVGTAGNLDGDRMTSDWTSGNRTIKWINGIITLQVYVGIIVLDLFLVSCLNDCSKFLFEGLTICVMYFGRTIPFFVQLAIVRWQKWMSTGQQAFWQVAFEVSHRWAAKYPDFSRVRSGNGQREMDSGFWYRQVGGWDDCGVFFIGRASNMCHLLSFLLEKARVHQWASNIMT